MPDNPRYQRARRVALQALDQGLHGELMAVYFIQQGSLGQTQLHHVPTGRSQSHPAHTLFRLTQDSARAVRALERMHQDDQPFGAERTVAGLAMVNEAWRAPDNQAQELYRRKSAGGSIPDFGTIPGSHDIVMVGAVLGGEFAWLQREGAQITEVTGQGRQVEGRIPDAVLWCARQLKALTGSDAQARAQAVRDTLSADLKTLDF